MVLYANADRLALGRFCSTVGLGLYSFSLGWVFHVGNVSETVFGGVSVPLYAKLQDELDRLRDSYCRILGYTALIAAGLLTGLVIVVPDAVHLVLPERYHLAIQTLQILGLYYMVRAVDTTTGQLYAAIGRPKLDMALNGVNLAALAAIIVPLVMWFGPAGAALAVLAARAVRLAVNVLVCRRAIACPVARFADSVMPAVWASAAMALVLVGVKTQWADASGAVGWVRLAVLILGGAGIYVGVIYVAHRRLFAEVLNLVREALAGRKGQREQQT
jgi:O-antigen/teichoic acid export membrane protein